MEEAMVISTDDETDVDQEESAPKPVYKISPEKTAEVSTPFFSVQLSARPPSIFEQYNF